jgi:hypothetical protein
MADKNFKVKTGLDIPVPLPVSMGGTGQTSSSNFLNEVLPSQTNNSGKALQTDGTNVSWITLPTGYSIGNTASRPASPSNGQLYSNTQTGFVEIYSSTYGWEVLGLAPTAPTSVVATNQGSGRAYNNGQASVSFTPPTTAARSYTVTSSPGSFTATGTSSPIVITGLQSSTSYTFTATSTNGYGTSAASAASAGITATTVPQAPTIGTAAASTATQVAVTFTAGATGGSAITQYTVTSTPGSITATGSSSPITVSNLTTGTSYTFKVTATNANGTSAESAASNSATPQFQGVPLLGTWIQGTSRPTTISNASHWGITTVSGQSRVYTSDADRSSSYRYNDGKGGSWTTASSRPEGQGLSTSSKYYTSDNRVYTVGGDTGDPDNVYALNAEGNSWSTYTQSPISASWGNGAYFNGHLYTMNNLGGSPVHASARTTTNNGTSWSSYAATPEYRYGGNSAPMHNKLLYWGGFAQGWAGSTSVYSTTGSGSWTTETAAPHTGNTFLPYGFATNGTYSRVYTISGNTIWSRTHDSGTWVQEASLSGRNIRLIMMVQNGSELWVQAQATDGTIWYQRLL